MTKITASGLKPLFDRVVIYARQHRANLHIEDTLMRLTSFLNSLAIQVFVDEDTAQVFDLALPILERKHLNRNDLLIVVGGDGSLLSAASIAVLHDTPVVGINRGRLGFLTDINPNDMDTHIADIIHGKFKEESRFLLSLPHANDKALNDIVLTRGENTHLIEFSVFVDGALMGQFRSDGLIISTPTGSTAYALSAGGPILHPELNAITIVPMFSHSLSSRPMVIHGKANIEIQIADNHEKDLDISCDGRQAHPIQSGQRIIIEQYPKQLRLLHPENYRYYDTLRAKLGWEGKYQG